MKKGLTIGIIFLVLFITGCAVEEQAKTDDAVPEEKSMPEQNAEETESTAEDMKDMQEDMLEDMDAHMGESAAEWMDIELKDVATGETFRISDFKGSTVLVQSFAVWNTISKGQQDRIERLLSMDGINVTAVSIDIDLRETEERVKGHIEEHGYDWRYAVATPELKEALIDDYGNAIIDVVGSPILLVCENQSTRLLKRGSKTETFLKQEIDKGC